MMESNLRAVIEGMEEHRQATARLMKSSQIQGEIDMISNVDKKAKTLERREKQLAKRVKETFQIQQVALGQIQELLESDELDLAKSKE